LVCNSIHFVCNFIHSFSALVRDQFPTRERILPTTATLAATPPPRLTRAPQVWTLLEAGRLNLIPDRDPELVRDLGLEALQATRVAIRGREVEADLRKRKSVT
jgi:hypothetical protein